MWPARWPLSASSTYAGHPVGLRHRREPQLPQLAVRRGRRELARVLRRERLESNPGSLERDRSECDHASTRAAGDADDDVAKAAGAAGGTPFIDENTKSPAAGRSSRVDPFRDAGAVQSPGNRFDTVGRDIRRASARGEKADEDCREYDDGRTHHGMFMVGRKATWPPSEPHGRASPAARAAHRSRVA